MEHLFCILGLLPLAEALPQDVVNEWVLPVFGLIMALVSLWGLRVTSPKKASAKIVSEPESSPKKERL